MLHRRSLGYEKDRVSCLALKRGYVESFSMDQVTIGASGLQGSRLIYGCWRLARTWDPGAVTAKERAAGKKALDAAIEAGFTVYDLADVYTQGIAEEIFGEWLQDNPGIRERIIVITKGGIRLPCEPGPHDPYRYDFSGEYIRTAVDASLNRLHLETIDLYLLHRPDPLMAPAELASTFQSLQREGKVNNFGVSNFTVSQFTALNDALERTLCTNQIEVSLTNLERFNDGFLDYCLQHPVRPMAWSPLGGGALLSEDRLNPAATKPAHIERIRHGLVKLAGELDTQPATLALSWLLKHPAGILPIIGSTDPERIRRLPEALDLNLSREHWYTLFELALGSRLP